MLILAIQYNYINMVCWDIFYRILLKHNVLTMIHILDTTGIKT